MDRTTRVERRQNGIRTEGAPGLMSRLRSRLTSRLTSRLAAAAGLNEAVHAESLEQRQLLFSLTVSAQDVNPATGIGQVTASFAYVIPYLATNAQAQTQQPTIRTEPYDDEPPGAFGSGQFFLGSGLRALHGITPAGDFAVQPGGDQAENRWLRAAPNNVGEFFAFEFWNDPDAPAFRVQASQFTMRVDPDGPTDNTGLLSGNFRMTLVSNNLVIATFQGAQLQALFQITQPGDNPALGVGTFLVNAPVNSGGFDTIRFEVINAVGGNPAFRIDDTSYTLPAANNAAVIENAIFGATLTLTGPVGATIIVEDLRGDDMVLTLALGVVQGGSLPIVDGDGDGNPNFNAGIGRIRILNSDARTSLTMWGGTIEAAADTRPEDAYAWDGQFAFFLADDLAGIYDDFEQTGFGYAFRTQGQQLTVTGLPPGPGSLIIGSPFVRPRFGNPYAPAAANPVVTGFNNPNQGIFVENGSIGSISIHGVVHGASRIAGSADHVNIGYMVGSLTVEGDLGALYVGSDLGQWSPDPDFTPNPGVRVDQNNKTGSQIIVGRTAGQIFAAGRGLADITIIGDVNSPISRPARDVYTYYEREWVTGVDPSLEDRDMIIRHLNASARLGENTPSGLFRNIGQYSIFGLGTFRNDSILGSEWIGSITSGVRIKGELSGQDPFNGEDRVDVYGFAVDGTQEIVIEGSIGLPVASLYFRIVDQEGRTLAAPQLPATAGRFAPTQLRWTPSAPGAYYLVVMDPNGNDDDATGNVPYTVNISGMATTTLGSYRTGAGSGFTDVTTGTGNSLNVLAGNVGSIRIGTGYVGGDGDEVAPNDTINTIQTEDDVMSFIGGTHTIQGTLYNITTGSDIGSANGTAAATVTFRIGGNLGTLFTGLSEVVGRGPGEGDMNFFDLSVGGSIGVINVQGGIGMDQDEADPRARVGIGSVIIRTGTSGGSGNIGLFRTGFHVGGDCLTIITSPNSTIGAFLTSQDAYTDGDPRSGVYQGLTGVPIITGVNSDVRFVDLIRLDLQAGFDIVLPIIGDRPLELVDDSGARVSISVEGAPPDVQVGTVRAFPITGSQGVAIGQIIVDLSGGRQLRIQQSNQGGGGGAQTGGVVSVGRIIVTGSDFASGIDITGNTQVDVYRIESAGALDRIANRTPGGDIVAIDVAGLNSLDLAGDLGRTQWTPWGPDQYAPFLGLVGGQGGGLRAPLPVGPATLYDNDWNGEIFRPINDDNFDTGNAYLDDLGAPMDGWLNGMVVRAGSVLEVRVDGGVGDVILAGADSVLVLLNVNADRVTGFGRFDGIFGTVFANDIGRIELGNGVRNGPRGANGPFATGGIFAVDDIFEIVSVQPSGTIVSAPIIAGNATDPDLPGVPQDGITTLRIVNGRIEYAFIGSQTLDGFWTSFNFDEEDPTTGDIQRIELNNTDLYGSTIRGRNLEDLVISNGYFDASVLSMTQNIGNVSARGYRNSTLVGDQNEVRENLILGGRDLRRLSAVEDITDLTIDLVGAVTQNITAVNITRSSIDVDNEIKAINVTNDIRGTDINAGATPSITVGRNFQSSTLSVAGRITTLTAGGGINNTRVTVTGPSGSIGTISAVTGISGVFTSTGPITSINVTGGDLVGEVNTLNANGNVGTLRASGDVAIRTDIAGNLSSIIAGRNIGRVNDAGVILVRGDLQSATAPNGQLHADIRVGGSILGTVAIGGATAKPGNDQVGRGSVIASRSIAGVTATGDFGGSIISYSGGIGNVSITNGSFYAGGIIAAYDGNIASITITNGSLFGDVHADYNLTSLRVLAGADGVFGDIGVNPASSSLASYDARRNQLPVGTFNSAAVQGPRISAGFNIVNVAVTGGSVFETAFVAGRSIQTITIAEHVANDSFTPGVGSFFAAGDSIDNVTIGGNLANAAFVAGVVSLGADNRPGGTGANADVIKSGSIVKVAASGLTFNTTFSAGISPGLDGVYNTGDDRVALGLSTITTLALSNVGGGVSAFGDILSTSVANDNRYIRGGTNLPSLNLDLDTGFGVPGTAFSGSRTFTYSGATVTIIVSGPGQAFFNEGTGRLTLRNTSASTNVTVTSSTGSIANFDVVTNDDASLGSLVINADLSGDSDIVVDGTLNTLTLRAFTGTGSIAVGADAGTVTFASFAGGSFRGRHVQTFRVNGDYGAANALVTGEAFIHLLSAGTITITGAARANVSVDRDASTIAVTGAADRANFRVGGSLNAFTAGSMSRSVLSVSNTLSTVTVNGDAFASTIAAGLDLGEDSFFGGAGLNADRLSTGFLGTVTIAGNFRESNVVSGYARGADGFFGSTDDTIAPGRSTITRVTIGGSQVGSSRGSESYRIASSGTLGLVTLGGQAFSGTFGNFATEVPNLPPAPVQVTDIRTGAVAGVWSANIIFNQPIDASSLSGALSLYEVRGAGDILLRLVEGVDYTVSYNAALNTGVVTFARALTSANFPQVSGRPGPGVYRVVIEQSLFRARLANQNIDGNGDGFVRAGENFSQDVIVGDAGDKFLGGVAFANGNPANRVDFYPPINLNLLLDANDRADGLPDTNRTFTVRGSIGDHPDTNNTFFSFASDVDVYAITLQAGQILRLSGLSGPAELAGLTLFDPNGNAQGTIVDNASAISLPVPQGTIRDLTFPTAYLIRTTGTYFLAVGNTATIGQSQVIPNIPIPPGGIGDYSFTVSVFDDGNSGFSANTTAGNGTNVVEPPPAISFAGTDRVFDTTDDLAQIVIGAFTFTHDRGPDGLPNTADDLVRGTNNDGITVVRDSSGRITSTIRDAIGTPGSAGVPSVVEADVDVFHLNNRQPIAPGTRMAITVKLTELGADLGSAQPPRGDRGQERLFLDNRGAVQFALFDTSSSTTIDDAALVFSPTDFRPNGGKPNTVIADNGTTKYGFNAQGDFYIEFVTPDRSDIPGAAASFAVYLQGVYNTDYEIVVVQGGTGDLVRSRQNVFIETGGGEINWLQVAGAVTTLAPFDASTLGFTGSAPNGQPVQTYILNQLTSTLNSLFRGATTGPGLDVRFSTNPADFEGEQFSTIFVSSTVDPIAPLFDPFLGFNFNFLSQQFVNTQPYGFSQRSDPFNTDLTDEAVVFVPSFALLGLTPSQVDIDAFVQSLTGAVARRVGELVGLRISDVNAPAGQFFDPFAANSVDTRPGIGRAFTIPAFNRSLSTSFDTVQRTDFFLGQQNARSLLLRVINTI